MKVFAYLKQKKTDFKKTNLFILQKKQQRINFIKNIFVGFSFIVCVISYAIVVTRSSTKWYFLSQAQEEKSKIQFSYNIETLNMSEYKKNLWEQLKWDANVKKIKFDLDLVKNIDDKKLTFKK